MDEKHKAQYQCMCCGEVYWIEDPPDIDKDELYVKMKCKCCGKTENHLWVGEREEDKYLYYDCTIDSRYY